jgi:hypothetical protein
LSKEVETLASWLGIDYALPYDPDLDGPPETADEREVARRLRAFAARRRLEIAHAPGTPYSRRLATMSTHALKAHIARMARSAERYLADADLLEGHLGRQSDAAYLLELLAFEIRLKALLLIHRVESGKHHAYRKLFESLPDSARDNLIHLAQERMTTEADYSDVGKLLATWGRNFSELRYAYERYEGQTAEEYEQLGADWVAKGAPDDEACFRFHPNELFGLHFVLQSEIGKWLESSP